MKKKISKNKNMMLLKHNWMKQTRMIFLIVIKKFVKRVLNARMHQDRVSAGWYFCVGQARRHTHTSQKCVYPWSSYRSKGSIAVTCVAPSVAFVVASSARPPFSKSQMSLTAMGARRNSRWTRMQDGTRARARSAGHATWDQSSGRLFVSVVPNFAVIRSVAY